MERKNLEKLSFLLIFVFIIFYFIWKLHIIEIPYWILVIPFVLMIFTIFILILNYKKTIKEKGQETEQYKKNFQESMELITRRFIAKIFLILLFIPIFFGMIFLGSYNYPILAQAIIVIYFIFSIIFYFWFVSDKRKKNKENNEKDKPT